MLAEGDVEEGPSTISAELDVWMAELEEIDRAIARFESFKTQTFVFGTGGIVLLVGSAFQSAAAGETVAQMLVLLLVALVSAFLGMFLVDRDEAILAQVNYRETVLKPRVRALLGSQDVLSSWEFFNREVYGRNRPVIRKFAHRLTAPFPHALFYVSGLGSFGYLLYERATGGLSEAGWAWALGLTGAALAYSWTAAFLTGAQWANVASPPDERGIPFMRRRSRCRLPQVKGWSPGDPHVHTNWSDGWRSVWSQAESAARRNLEWIVITDHADKVGEDWAGFVKTLAEVEGRLGDVLLVPGAEVSVVDRPGGAVQGDLLIYGWPTDGDPPPANRVSSASGTLGRVAASRGAYAGVAHPFNGGAPFGRGVPGTKFGAAAWADWTVAGAACIELMSYERVPSESTLERWFSLLDEHLAGGPFVAVTGGTDSHFPWDMPASRGMTWAAVGEAGPVRREAVLAALRNGRSVVSGVGDFGTLSVGNAGPGQRHEAGGVVAVRITQRPAPGRHCASVELYGPERTRLLRVDGPFEPEFSLPVDVGPRGYVVARFTFTGRRSKVADVWTNPVFVGSVAGDSETER